MTTGWVPTRIPPKMPVQAYQTYQAVRPTQTHTKVVTCAQVDCQAAARGWVTLCDVSTEVGRARANYIRIHSGRSFTVQQAGDKVTFTFPAGQQCFTEHRVPIDKPTIYLKRGGDWRATTFDPQVMRLEDWIDDFANHQNNLADKIKEG